MRMHRSETSFSSIFLPIFSSLSIGYPTPCDTAGCSSWVGVGKTILGTRSLHFCGLSFRHFSAISVLFIFSFLFFFSFLLIFFLTTTPFCFGGFRPLVVAFCPTPPTFNFFTFFFWFLNETPTFPSQEPCRGNAARDPRRLPHRHVLHLTPVQFVLITKKEEGVPTENGPSFFSFLVGAFSSIPQIKK